jgi:ribosomal protein S18 acetylase RimI-like enzyme
MQATLKKVLVGDDLAAICAQMQPGKWAPDNEMTSYQPESLKRFLDKGGILLLAYEDEIIAGAALCYELPHPAGEDSLYVHELDTHPDFRRRGIATQLMNEVRRIAVERNLTEVWVGTETDNNAANALYRNLGPDESEQCVIYSYKIS